VAPLLAIVTLIVVATVRVASAQDGPGAIAADPLRPGSSAPAPPVSAAVPINEAIRLDEYLNRLDEWRNQGRISAAESAKARRLLYAAVVTGDRSVHVPLDASGRIDLLALARGAPGSASASTLVGQPGEQVVSRVLNEFDLRMRVKARDLATQPNLAQFDAAPGYTAVPARELSRIVKSALETTPLKEVPGGTRIVQAVDVLPNTAGVKSEQTIRELSNLVGDRQSDWVKSRVGTFIAGHKLEAGLIAFGAITGLRMASPQTARFADRFGLRVRISRLSTPDARLYTTSRLVYRNGYVLPELELEGGARRVRGAMTLRATVGGVFGAEASQHTRGRMALGARWERGHWFADTNAISAFPEHLVRTELRGGYLTETGLAISSAVAATFGHGSGAFGVAAGRLGYELDVTKALRVSQRGGEVGLFVSTGADSDFSHTDWRGGLVFRLGL